MVQKLIWLESRYAPQYPAAPEWQACEEPPDLTTGTVNVGMMDYIELRPKFSGVS